MDNQNFANTGTESYKIPGAEQSDGRVILNIQEEQPKGIVLDKKGQNATSNFFSNMYKGMNQYLITHSNIKAKEKVTFYHLLSVMVNAGIPMVKALRSLVAQLDKSPKLQVIVEDLSEAIENGSSLSEAMLDYGNVFSESEVGMIQSGEATGQLSSVMENLSTDAEKAYMIRSKVKGAMMYPIVILCLLVVVVVAMMVLVIPKLTQLFDNLKGELPLITRIVVGISDFFVTKGLYALIGVAILIFAFSIFKKTDSGKYLFDKFKLSIPVFGGLFQKAYLARFARSLSNLLDSNVSILRTLEITANSIGNEVYRKRLILAAQDIKQGIPLAENLTSSSLFPPMLVNMIDVGERTAQLSEISLKVATFYESEVDTSVNGISKIIEPIIMVFIGAIVATVVAAIMLPIMQLSDLSGML